MLEEAVIAGFSTTRQTRKPIHQQVYIFRYTHFEEVD